MSTDKFCRECGHERRPNIPARSVKIDEPESKYAEQYHRLLAINARVEAELVMADAAKNIKRSMEDHEVQIQIQVAREIALCISRDPFLDVKFEGAPVGKSVAALTNAGT
jgi:hypothetical protein